jgi:hypothetical protein
MLCLSYYILCFLFNTIRQQEGGTGSAQKEGWQGGNPTIYTHVIKGKDNKARGLGSELSL